MRSLALLVVLLPALAMAQEPRALEPTNVLSWPRAGVDRFGCMLEKDFETRDPRFNCGNPPIHYRRKMGMRVHVSRCVAELIQRSAAEAAPQEACGLLFGENGAIEAANVAANVAQNPRTRFEIDPAALFAALRAERAGGPALAGYWHSHPSGDASPSATDAAMAAPDGRLWLIATGEAITAWQAVAKGERHGRFVPLELDIG